MSRNRTLLGTELIPLRISTQLITTLDQIAKEQGTSRNTLMGRVLASFALGYRHQESETASEEPKRGSNPVQP